MTDSLKAVVQPGSGHASQTALLQQGVSLALKQLNNNQTPVNTVVPEGDASPLSKELDYLREKTHLDLDLEGILSAEQVRSKPANKFLSVFLTRLKKLHPGKQIVKE